MVSKLVIGSGLGLVLVDELIVVMHDGADVLGAHVRQADVLAGAGEGRRRVYEQILVGVLAAAVATAWAACRAIVAETTAVRGAASTPARTEAVGRGGR
jgi:hypothetical protein